MEKIFPISYMPGNFLVDGDVINYALLLAGFYCIYLNSVGFFFWCIVTQNHLDPFNPVKLYYDRCKATFSLSII